MKKLLIAMMFVGCLKQPIITAAGGPQRNDPRCTAEGTQFCDGLIPRTCSSELRAWANLSRRPDGTQRTCLSACAVDNGLAHCVGD